MECAQSSVKILKDNLRVSLRYDSTSVSGYLFQQQVYCSEHIWSDHSDVDDIVVINHLLSYSNPVMI